MMDPDAVKSCYDTIRVHSKSFALASRLFARDVRDRAVVVYAWCRRADDAIDLAGRDGAAQALTRLRGELDDIYAGRDPGNPTLRAFQVTVKDCAIHRTYPEDLLAGMEMDVMSTRYDSMELLLRYCYCVAGTVGLMMCHVMGVTNEDATRNAVHMGMAMQLTNICRDVLEDWELGRLYIPDPLLEKFGCHDLASRLGSPFPETAVASVAQAIDYLLREADRYYASGDTGLRSLSWRCALSVGTARRVYAAIGARVRRMDCNPLLGRAVVPLPDKLGHVAAALGVSVADLPRRFALRIGSSGRVAAPRRLVKFPADVLPV
ncbi:MAG: phytoene/squalene synthase family protein [Candidatus Latescibacterota bacterium]|nr:MAG: phytoene/squalene synthase family protein [Candidatus Latescibacterota bacterium]